MSKVPPDPPLVELKMELEDESSSEGSSGSFSDSDDSEDLENSRKIQEFQAKVTLFYIIINDTVHLLCFYIVLKTVELISI